MLIYVAWALGIASIVSIVVFIYLNFGNLEKAFAGASYTSNGIGSWTSNASWVGGTQPSMGANDNTITIKGSHTITSGALTAKQGVTFSIQSNGTLYIAGDLTADNNLTINVSGTLVVTGSLIAKNGGKLNVNTGGTVKISGNMTFDQNAIVKVNGGLSVNGAIAFGSNPTFSGTGLVSTGGSGCSAWTGPGTCSYGTLPVKLLSFTADYANGSVKLNWQTASEENNDFFTIERTGDGINYSPIATIPGAGTTVKISNYGLEDLNPLKGTSYYRLTQTDYDGKRESFPQVSVNANLQTSGFTLYPNPLVGNVLNISFANPGEGMIEIVDSKGNKVFTKETNNEEKLQLNLDENIIPGIYFVSYATGTTNKTERLVKK